jgi:outer membrane protein TolC
MRTPEDRHEPSVEFVTRLESQIGSEVRRRNRDVRVPRWAGWSFAQVATAAILLVLVSMGAGGAAVAAAYEAQSSQSRDTLLAAYSQRAELARQRLDVVRSEQKAAEARFNVGLSDVKTLLDKGVAVVNAQAEVAVIQLQVEEIRLSGREPRAELSAPRVSGRDFVSERLRMEMTVPEKTLEVGRKVAQEAATRVEIGTLAPIDLEQARTLVLGVESSLTALQQKLAIRQQFLAGKIDATETELRTLEADAQQRTAALAPQIALAAKEVVRLEQRVEVGVSRLVDVAEAKLHRNQLEMELSKAELDLAMIRLRLEQYRGRSRQ